MKSSSTLANQNGTVNSRNYFYPFGGNRGGAAFSALTTKRFTGQYHEQGLPGGEGLSYYGARWYDAQLGRFTGPDILVPGSSNPQSFNRYAYVLNNPINHVDPTGHCPDPDEYVGCETEAGGPAGGGGGATTGGFGGGGSGFSWGGFWNWLGSFWSGGGQEERYSQPSIQPFATPQPLPSNKPIFTEDYQSAMQEAAYLNGGKITIVGGRVETGQGNLIRNWINNMRPDKPGTLGRLVSSGGVKLWQNNPNGQAFEQLVSSEYGINYPAWRNTGASRGADVDIWTPPGRGLTPNAQSFLQTYYGYYDELDNYGKFSDWRGRAPWGSVTFSVDGTYKFRPAPWRSVSYLSPQGQSYFYQYYPQYGPPSP